MRNSLVLILIGLTTFITACSDTTNPSLIAPPPDLERASNKGGAASMAEKAKAEIVFVVDNSASMEKHIQNVSNNINKFVDAFAGKFPLDFNVAVTSVYDTRNFNSLEFKNKFKDSELIRDNGEFYPIKEDGKATNKFFLSSEDENLKPKLKQLLKVQVQDLENAGPEVEESLSPIKAIYLDSQKGHETHKGFFMGPNAYRIFVFITDASDNSDLVDHSAPAGYSNTLSVADFYNALVAQSGRDKVMAFGAIFASKDVHNSSVTNAEAACMKKADPGVKNDRLERFLTLAKPSLAKDYENIVHLCNDNFGEVLAGFGKMIKQQTQSYSIKLTHGKPDLEDPDSVDSIKRIVVSYGNQRFSWNDYEYTYDPASNTIHIVPDAIEKYIPGAVFQVEYLPIHKDVRVTSW